MIDIDIEVILTGTGTPVPVPNRAGPGVLIRTPDATVQVDTGRGTVLRLAEAGVRMDELDAVCITHHHSDHTTDLSDVLVSAWLMDATRQVDLLAPTGLAAEFARAALDPFVGDLSFRREHRSVANIAEPNVIEFTPTRSPMTVWQRGDTRIEAVSVRHEPVEMAVGYRISTATATVVVSGDTRACKEIEALAHGADVLVHEVVDPDRVPDHRRHTIEYHAIPEEVGALAAKAGVTALVLTHLWPAPTSDAEVEALLVAVRRGGFTGDVVVGCDLAAMRVIDGEVTFTLPGHFAINGRHDPKLLSFIP